mmetsp:Transcript_39180/g.47435  ORF Transcript_39180/g.47435 Transcript_39180/m.47435 type:complete len:332 (-) Transcript_39180:395-1390(-)
MNTSHNLTGSKQAGNRLIIAEHARLRVAVKTSHAVVQNWRNNSDVEVVLDVEGSVVEELLAVGALARLSALVVALHGAIQNRRVDAHLLRKISTGGVVLHHPTADVVLAVPENLLGALAVEHQTEGSLVLPHLAGDVVTATELISKSLSVGIQKDTAHTTQGLSSQELHLSIRLVRVHKSGRVNLNALHIYTVSSNSHGHLDTISSAVLSVCGGKMREVGPELVQERVGCEVSSESTSGDHNWSELFVNLSVFLVSAADDVLPFLDQVGHAGLRDDTSLLSLGILLALLESLKQSVSDCESWELLFATVSAGLRVTAKTRDKRKVKTEVVD